MNFSDIANTDRYYNVVDFSSIAFQRTVRGSEDGVLLPTERLGSPVHCRRLYSDHFINSKKSNYPTFPAYVPSLFAYVASPLKRRCQRDMVRYQRIQASKKRRLEITFQTIERCLLGSSVQLVVSQQKEKDHMHGTLDNISSLSQVHHVNKEITQVSEITLAPSTATIYNRCDMRGIGSLQTECELLKQ